MDLNQIPSAKTMSFNLISVNIHIRAYTTLLKTHRDVMKPSRHRHTCILTSMCCRWFCSEVNPLMNNTGDNIKCVWTRSVGYLFSAAPQTDGKKGVERHPVLNVRPLL